jgi:Domain of unknown function (DUF1735)
MKFQVKIYSFLLLVWIMILGSGCLKDKAYNNGEIQSGHGSDVKVIAVGANVASASNFLNLSLNTSATDTTLNILAVTLGAKQPAQEDIHVTLIQNNKLVTDYNTAQSTDYSVPTTISFVNPGLVVVIPKGSYVGYLQAKFIPNDFINGAPYALGFSIKSIAESGYTISGNLQNGIVAIGIKNKYDGNYGLVIKTLGWSAYGISENMSGTWPSNSNGTSIGMVTSGASSVIMFDYYAFGSEIQVAFTTGNAASTGFGATAPKFTFDPATNEMVSVTNAAAPDPRNRQFKMNTAAGIHNYYDPATKTIYAAYFLSQNGRPDMQIYDTLTYIGPRP